jgi:hypothetical protein
MKQVELLIKIMWEDKVDEGEVVQHFAFKDSKYIHNPSYILHTKFEKKLAENAISYDPDMIFKDMTRNNNRVSITYSVHKSFNFKTLKPKFYKVVGVVPDNEGCRFCRFHEKKKGLYGTCTFQEKDLVREVKSCRFFKQKKSIKT